MNIQNLIRTCGYQDFLLVEAPRDEVIAALGRDIAEAEESALRQRWVHPVLRIVARIFGYGAAYDWADRMARDIETRAGIPSEGAPYRLHSGPDADDGDPILQPTQRVGDPRSQASAYSGDGWDDLRVSTVAGRPGLTLVEMQQHCSGFSPWGFGLSSQMPGKDVLFFRRSSAWTAERHFDFHLYRDGDTLRRVLCHAQWPFGDAAKEWWEVAADGQLSRYEPGDLYHAGTTEADLLNDAKIDRILGHFGLTADALLAQSGRTSTVLLSRRAGGGPLPV